MKKTLALLLIICLFVGIIPAAYAENVPITLQMTAGYAVSQPIYGSSDIVITSVDAIQGVLPNTFQVTASGNQLYISGTPTEAGSYSSTIFYTYYRVDQPNVYAQDSVPLVINIDGSSNDTPIITYHPDNQTGSYGGTLTFSAGTLNAIRADCVLVEVASGAVYDSSQIKALTGCDASFSFNNGVAALTIYNISNKLNNYAVRFRAYGNTGTAVQSYDAYMNVDGGGAINITKHPGDETIDDGGRAIFIAAADNVKSWGWQLFTANGSVTYEIPAGLGAVPGLTGNCYQDSTGRFICELYNVSSQLDGYYVKAVFAGADNVPVYTNQAYIHVNKKELAVPTITVQPKGETVKEENREVTLNVAATAASGSLMYEWYSSESNSIGTMQTTGVKGTYYKPPKTEKPMYYACAVWTEENGTKSAVTWTTPVEVKYEITATPTPSPTATPAPSPETSPEVSPSPTPSTAKTVRKGPGFLGVLLILLILGIAAGMLFLFKDKLWPKDDEEIYVCSNCGWTSKPGKSPPSRCPVCGVPLEFDDDDE